MPERPRPTMRRAIELPPPPRPDPDEDPLALAVAQEIVERGGSASAAGVIARSGLDRAAFEARYSSLQDCALDSYERQIAAFERRVGGVFHDHPDWRTSLRAAAYETADWMEEHPVLVHFGMTAILRLDCELARVRREELFIFCAGLIDLGRQEEGSQIGADDPASMFAIGSIMQLLTHRLQAGEPFEPHAIVPEMMFIVVRTYLGEEAAREELSLSRPSAGITATPEDEPQSRR